MKSDYRRGIIGVSLEKLMTIRFMFILSMVLLAVNPATASAQVPIPPDIGRGIGPSGAQAAGAIAGLAAVVGLVLYLTLHKPSVVGCTQSVYGVSTLTDEKDKHTYILVSDGIDLKTHERLALKGKKTKERGGTFKFGTDFVEVLGAQTFSDFVAAMQLTINNVRATKPPLRMQAIAHQIAIKQPDLVSLQEVTTWRVGPGPTEPRRVRHAPRTAGCFGSAGAALQPIGSRDSGLPIMLVSVLVLSCRDGLARTDDVSHGTQRGREGRCERRVDLRDRL